MYIYIYIFAHTHVHVVSCVYIRIYIYIYFIYIYIYTYIYIYIYTHARTHTEHGGPPGGAGSEVCSTANLRTNIMAFRGFDYNVILIQRGWSYHVHRGFPGKFESSNLSRDNVSREIGRTSQGGRGSTVASPNQGG